jgi:hypothetical protein
MSQIITLLFAIQLGIMPINSWYEDNSYQPTLQNNAVYINLDTEVLITDYLFVGGWIDTYMLKNEQGHTFKPLQQTYQFRAGVRLDNIEIGYEHVCGPHPVFTYPQYGTDQPSAPFEGAYDKFYIQISNY